MKSEAALCTFFCLPYLLMPRHQCIDCQGFNDYSDMRSQGVGIRPFSYNAASPSTL